MNYKDTRSLKDEDTMALHSLCGSDPLLEFKRKTYDAIPLRVPDKRVQRLIDITQR
jgi:hypothetical protein